MWKLQTRDSALLPFGKFTANVFNVHYSAGLTPHCEQEKITKCGAIFLFTAEGRLCDSILCSSRAMKTQTKLLAFWAVLWVSRVFCRLQGRECRGAAGQLPAGSRALQQADQTSRQQEPAGHHLHTAVIVSAHQRSEYIFKTTHKSGLSCNRKALALTQILF